MIKITLYRLLVICFLNDLPAFFKCYLIYFMESEKIISSVYSKKMRVAVFGSFYRGYHVLNELLYGEVSRKINVVGVATDDVSQNFISPHKRVWQYPHTPAEKEMVSNIAEKAGIETYNGRVKSSEFYEIMESRWKPDLCIMATFGQKIDSRLFNAPPLGFYNLHPCIDDAWPSRYVGGNPFQALLDDKKEHTVIALHRVDDDFDTGELLEYSEKIFIPPNASVTDLHKITSPIAAKLASRNINFIYENSGGFFV